MRRRIRQITALGISLFMTVLLIRFVLPAAGQGAVRVEGSVDLTAQMVIIFTGLAIAGAILLATLLVKYAPIEAPEGSQ